MKTMRSTRGYALAIVLCFSTMLCLTAAVLLKYSGTEFRLNQRNQLRFQAKNAAEAVLEYGASELMMRLQKNLNFSTTELRASPITAHTTRKSTLFATSTSNNVAASDLSFWASQYTESTRKYVDPNDPGNNYDPLRGQNVRTQTIRLLSSATARVTGLVETQYATQSIEIRDAYLFNYAIFYNIPMEFHPGADMTIAGPVHSNVTLNLSASSVLKFTSTVTTADKLTAGPLSNAGTGRPTGRNVQFTTGLDLTNDGVLDTIAVNDSAIQNAAGTASLGTYVDSYLNTRVSGAAANNTFAQIASQVWRGNVQDSTMGVIAQNLPAISANNSAEAHDLIEPRVAANLSSSDSAVVSRENQKFSNKAGLYIVQGAAGTDGAAAGTAPAAVGFFSAADAAAYKAAANRATWRASNPTKVITLPTGMVKNNRRMKDMRENRIVNTVDIDMGKMKAAVAPAGGAAATDKFQINGSDWNLDASTGGWNGQVYVEVESPTAGYTSTSDVLSGTGEAAATGTGTRTSVRLVNGSSLPNRKAVTASANEGVTVATNAPVYVVGNYNSPGVNAGTRSGTAVGTETIATIGDYKDGEVAAAVIADAVNILSNAWWSSGTLAGDASTLANSSGTVPSTLTASSTEICAAFLTGNVATTGSGNVDSNYSGGVENFPRLHENWTASGNRTLRYRGSMVALFNSEVATGQWTNARYSAPTREWGFNKMFGEGRQPPGTPMIRTFRRITYADLTGAQFQALLSNTTLGFTSM